MKLRMIHDRGDGMSRKFSVRRGLLRAALLLAAICTIGSAWAGSFFPDSLKLWKGRKPNFIVILTDDQGYQDVGCFGSTQIRTPNLDRMAREGMKFTDFYAAAPICSPSRAGLLTGCYPPRVDIPTVLFPTDTVGLNPSETTIAEMLKARGYATACFGKWHLGHKPEFLPTRQGFDTYLGIPYSNDMWIDPEAKLSPDIKLNGGATVEKIRHLTQPVQGIAPLMRNDEVIEYPVDQTTLTRRYTEEAIRFIKDNKKGPFFLYLPHAMPHVPLAASPAFRGKSPRGLYGDVIEEIDWSVGQILATLRSQGLDKNTFVIFTSDNGPWLDEKENGGSALPLRDGKFSTYEGGMREPCIMWRPGTVPAGKVCSEVASTIDFLPTLAALSGAAVPQDRVIDGRDISPLLTGKKGARSPHEAFYYYWLTDLQAVRCGNWKLHRAGDNKYELFDLSQDIGEKRDVAASHPDEVQRMKAMMERFDKDLKANVRPAGGKPAQKAAK